VRAVRTAMGHKTATLTATAAKLSRNTPMSKVKVPSGRSVDVEASLLHRCAGVEMRLPVRHFAELTLDQTDDVLPAVDIVWPILIDSHQMTTPRLSSTGGTAQC
jgi:hypothetical protein